ncbi:hypothetical protein Tco_0417198 [Tanacetum coccineum]
MNEEPNPSGSGTQEQLDEFDAWMDDFGTDDDEVPTEEVSQELLEELSEEVDEAQQQKANYLKSDIVWESRKEDLSLQLPKKPAPVYYSCQRDPKAPLKTLLHQDLFYLKHGNSGPKKYTLLLHNVEHWKNLWVKQHHIRRQEKKRDKPEEVYSDSKIVELGMEIYQQKVNLTAPTITFTGIERKKLLTITSKLVVGLIYENNKKEKRVMSLKKIPKFCDATLKRVLETVKKYNKNVKYGYTNPSPTDVDAEYLEFYEEYIKDRLKHRNQMRR